jgi:PAS domain S-box-containing protein
MTESVECRGLVLVVDDDAVARQILVAALKRDGFDCAQAVDGAQALQLLDQGLPDLVLLDATLPRVSGLEVLHTIRQRFGSLDLPVVMLQSRVQSDDILAALHLGANDYMAKPIDFGLLSRRVGTLVRHRVLAREAMVLKSRLALLVQSESLCVSLHGPDGRFIRVSKSLVSFLGRSEDELHGLRIHELMHPEDIAGLSRVPQTLPDTYVLLARFKRHSQFTWCEVEQAALRDGISGDVRYVQAIWRNRESRMGQVDALPETKSSADSRSFAFTPAPAQGRLSQRAREFGPPVKCESTPIPWPRTGSAPPVLIPGLTAEAQELARAQLADGTLLPRAGASAV